MHTFLIHYSVDEEFVHLDTFVAAAEAAKISLNAINKELLGDGLELELVVFPPESGSVKQFIGVLIGGVVGTYTVFWSMVQLMDSPSFQEIYHEIYGEKPSEAVIRKIRDWRERAQNEEEAAAIADEHGEELEEYLGGFVTRGATSIVEMPREEIDRLEVSIEFKGDAEEAQHLLFSAALEDQNVAAIGFDESDDFPIQRQHFAERALPPRKREEEENVYEWDVSIVSVRVTSPNFDHSDSRMWKGKVDGQKSILFNIVDESFWSKVSSDEVQFSEENRVVVQLAKRSLKGRPAGNVVVRVISVDGVRFAEPLSDTALEAILGKLSSSVEENDSRQGSFF